MGTVRRSRRAGSIWCVLLCSAVPATASIEEDAVRAYQEGELGRAAELFAEAATLQTDLDEKARLFNNSCFAYQQVGRLDSARTSCTEALAIRRLQDPGPGLARTLNNLGLVEQSLGRLADAHRLFLEAWNLNRHAGDLEGQVVNAGNMAAVDQAAGRLREAQTWLARADELLRQAGDQAWVGDRRAATVINRAVVLERLGEHDAALTALRELADTELDPRNRAYVASNIGVLYRNLGDPVSARRWLEEALDTARRLDDRGGEVNALLNLGRVDLENLGDWPSAQRTLTQALGKARAMGDRQQEAEALLHLGRSQDLGGQPEAAADSLELSLAIAREVGFLEGVEAALAARARLLLRRGDAATALGPALRGLDEVRALRESVTADSRPATAAFVSRRRELVEVAFRALEAVRHQGGDPARRTDGPALDQAVAGEAVPDGTADPLVVALAVVARGKPSPGSSRRGAAAGLLDEAERLRQRIEELEDAGGRALEYFVAEDVLYRVEIGQRRDIHRIGPMRPLRALVQRVHRALASRRAPAPEDLGELADALLPTWPEPPTHLVVAGDDVLRYLPFELLAPAPGATAGMRLADTTRIRYVPSLAWSSTGSDADPAALSVIALGAAGGAGRDGSGAADSRALAALERELEAVVSSFEHTRLIAPGEATPTRVLEALRSAPRITHFAGHAVLDDRSAPSSYLLLDPPDADDVPREEAVAALRPDALRDLDAVSALVVLSACSTGVSGPVTGWGLDTLVGAFLGAGATGTVASLWDVDDEATAVFMEQFYARLARGRSATTALRETKRAMAADPSWASPSDWAAFVLVGDDVSFPADRGGLPLPWVAGLAGAAALLLGLAAVSRRRRAA